MKKPVSRASGVQGGVKSLSLAYFLQLKLKLSLIFLVRHRKSMMKKLFFDILLFCVCETPSVSDFQKNMIPFKKHDIVLDLYLCLLFDLGPQMFASANSNCFHDRLLFRFIKHKKM